MPIKTIYSSISFEGEDAEEQCVYWLEHHPELEDFRVNDIVHEFHFVEIKFSYTGKITHGCHQ